MRASIVRIAASASLVVALAFTATASAQSPAVNPAEATAAASQAQRQQVQPFNNQPLWSEVRSGTPQYTSIAGRETNVLINPQGQAWRELRRPVVFWGGMLFAAALFGLAVFYMFRGPIDVPAQAGEPVIERFSPQDRYAHWTLAITWVTLGVTGLILSLGKTVLLPLIGYTLFSWLATLAKNLHNFVGPILIIAVPWMIVRYIRYNGISADDFRWFANIVGYFKGHEYPSGKFNAGEKAVFWLLLVTLTPILIVSGLVLVFPNFDQTRSTMQVANVTHMIAAYFAVAMAAVHIYLGTAGMTGAYRAMRDGYVTASWAKHHHLRWYEKVISGKAREKVVAPGTVVTRQPPPRQRETV